MKKIIVLLAISLITMLIASPPLFPGPPGGLVESAGEKEKTVKSKTGYFAGDIYDLVSEGKKGHELKSSRAFKGNLYKLIKDGNSLYSQEKFEEAEKVYAKAHDGAPNALVTNFNLACVLYKQGTYDAALVNFQTAYIAADYKTRAQILFNVGNTFFKQNDYTRAAEVYVESLKLDPGNKAAKHNLEMCLMETQKVPKMEERLTADDMPTEETKPGTHTNTVSEPEEHLKMVKKHLAPLDLIGSVGGTTESLVQFDSQYKDMTSREVEDILAQVEKEDLALLKELWRSRIVFSENTTKEW